MELKDIVFKHFFVATGAVHTFTHTVRAGPFIWQLS